MKKTEKITVKATANAPVGKVWKMWNAPEDIMQWNTPDPGWHTTNSVNDLRVGGHFKSRMEAREGGLGFDFQGTYDRVIPEKEIAYTMPDGRKVSTLFSVQDGKTHIETHFDAEDENPSEQQRQGWQAILDNFVKHVEAPGGGDVKIRSNEKA